MYVQYTKNRGIEVASMSNQKPILDENLAWTTADWLRCSGLMGQIFKHINFILKYFKISVFILLLYLMQGIFLSVIRPRFISISFN